MSTEHEEIEYLSQGVNYLGFLAQELGDLRGITGTHRDQLENRYASTWVGISTR